MAHANLTAFAVVLALSSLKRDARWGSVIPDSAALFYRACVQECARRDALFRFFTLIPDAIKFKLLDRMVAWHYAQHIAARKSRIETEARKQIAQGAKQLAVIGAGFDALALRLASEFPDVAFFELDLPDTQAAKRRALAAANIASPANLHFIGCDLSKTALDDALSHENAFAKKAPTVFIAEGLTMYLSAEENQKWFRAASKLSGAGTRILFTVMENSSAGDLGNAFGDYFLRKRASSYQFAVQPANIESFVKGTGYRLGFTATHEELQTPFLNAQEYANLRERMARSRKEHLYLAIYEGCI